MVAGLERGPELAGAATSTTTGAPADSTGTIPDAAWEAPLAHGGIVHAGGTEQVLTNTSMVEGHAFVGSTRSTIARGLVTEHHRERLVRRAPVRTR